jgi:hypothetical protein
MKSQKQSSRAPRPFKVRQDKHVWSGGKRDNVRDAFARAMQKTVKPAPPASPSPDASEADDVRSS